MLRNEEYNTIKFIFDNYRSNLLPMFLDIYSKIIIDMVCNLYYHICCEDYKDMYKILLLYTHQS